MRELLGVPAGSSRRPSAGSVLVVDDSADVRLGGISALIGAGYKVLQADSGESALHLLRSCSDQGEVFTDLHVVGMQGPERIRAIEADPT